MDSSFGSDASIQTAEGLMSEEKKDDVEQKPDAPKPYAPPTLTRWGTLRELTHGGGGIKTDPAGVGHPRSRA